MFKENKPIYRKGNIFRRDRIQSGQNHCRKSIGDTGKCLHEARRICPQENILLVRLCQTSLQQ